MTEKETLAILKIAIMAAFSDGLKSDAETEEINKIAESLNLEITPLVMQDIIFRRVSLTDLANDIQTPEGKSFCYEMAYTVCRSDSSINLKENEFLSQLKTLLNLSEEKTSEVAQSTETILDEDNIKVAEVPDIKTQEIDKMILNSAILNAALELLPQSIATMAIVPLQTRMVYNIGKRYGYNLDSGHIKEFLATAGAGLTSQYIETFARKLLGGVIGTIAGGLGRMATSAATGAAFTFASTYAIGKAANLYYSQGRRISMEDLKRLLNQFKEEGTRLFTGYEPEVRNRARNVNVSEIMSMVKGNRY